MTQPAISLIIPIYNVEQFLQHTLEVTVFFLCDLQVQDVAEQVEMSVFGGHVLDFGTRGVDQNML